MTIDEAKRIVLEKYPGAECRGNYYGYCIERFDGNYMRNLGDTERTEYQAWLSAAQRIKDKQDE